MAAGTGFDDLRGEFGKRPQQSGHEPISNRTTLFFASLAAIFVWYVPVGRLILSPVTFLNTFIHEYCHALMGWLTGGSVDKILVNNDASGLTWVAGGNPAMVAAAGYVGSAIAGAILLRLAHKKRLVRPLMTAFAAVIILGIVWKVRGEALGVTIGLVSSVLLLIGARFLPTAGAVFLAQFLAIQQCAASFQAFYWLFVANSRGIRENDAVGMENATGVPAVVWATLWSLFSAVLIFFSLRGVLRDSSRPNPPRPARTVP